MKIGLQDAIRTVHVTESSDVQNLVPAAGICSGARAILNESASVIGKKEHLFTPFDRIAAG